MSANLEFHERAKKLREEGTLSLRGALVILSNLQSDDHWYKTLKTKLAIRIVNCVALPQSAFFTWIDSTGVMTMINEKHAITKILDAVPLFHDATERSKGIMTAVMGDGNFDYILLEDINFVVERVVCLIMKNWIPSDSEQRCGFQTASDVRKGEFQASQQLLSRFSNRAAL